MCFLVISPFLHDFLKMQVIALRYIQYFNTWFLDGRTPRHVFDKIIALEFNLLISLRTTLNDKSYAREKASQFLQILMNRESFPY